MKQVVEAVISSPNWQKTMLIIIYDEHGGFYDHVPPPPAAQIAPGLPVTYGGRVPAFIVSPWVTGGMVFGNDAGSGEALYFDHTSILKTIAARFLSPNMPPMGARFEAANHLSSIMGSQARSGFFRPFIPYSFVFAPSGLSLEVESGTSTPDVPLWQNTAADSDAQRFALEDDGAGLFYIRTFTGRLYLTVDAPTTDPAQALAVRQDAKYAAGAANSNYQKWSIVPAQVSVIGKPMYRVVSAAFPDKVLQPLGASLNPETSVVVDTPENAQLGPLSAQYMWVITNPLVSGGLNYAPPNGGGQTLDASTSGLNFPPVEFTETSAPQTVTLVPTQGAQLIISSIAILSDTGAEGDFSTLPPPGSPPPYGTIQVQNGQLVLSASFHPTAAGLRTAVIQIAHNLANSPLTISLSGTGVPATHPVLSCSASSMNFSKKRPAPPPLKLTNTGNGPLTIRDISVNSSSFSFSAGCVTTIAPGQSCSVNVACRFIGAPDGTLTITHDAAGGQTQIDLSWEGPDGGS